MKKFGIVASVIVGIIVAVVILFQSSISLDPPEVAIEAGDSLRIQQLNDTLRVCENGWLRKNKYNFWEMYLQGDAVERGMAFGRLTQSLMAEKEAAFVGEIKKKIPSENYLSFLKYFVAWFNRDLDQYIPEEIKKEIYAGSFYMADEFDHIGPKYHRALNYHAAHDIGHALQNMNLVGCTAFAAWENRTENGDLLIGRNFDFYFGEAFAEDKIIAFVNPDEGYQFASVTWAGFSGVVSGINEAGLTVTLNSDKSAIPSKAKTPVSVIGRMILQYASTIEEAMEIATSYDSFVAESFLIGSSNDDKVGLIEKSQDTTVLYTTPQNEMVVTNHYQSKALLNTPLNTEYMAEEVSQHRYSRVENLLNGKNPLSAKDAAQILRDQMGEDSTFIGWGNERAINQLLAHHSVIFKPEQNLFWVSAPPYQLGSYVAYKLGKVMDMNQDSLAYYQPSIDSLTIPPDPYLHSEAFQHYRVFAGLRDKVRQFLFTGNDSFKLMEKEVQQFVDSNPESYMPYYYLGDYFIELKEYNKARQFLEEGLTKTIARTSERKHMEEALETCKKELAS